MEDNFHAKEGKGIKGIFTLGKKTAEELDEIAKLEDDVRRIDSEIVSTTNALSQLDTDQERAFNSAKDATWVIKSDYEKGPLRFCLEDNKVRGDKSRLFQHLAKAEDADASILIEDLLAEASEIEDETAEAKAELSIPANPFNSLENNHLLGSVIAGSSDSRLSALIATLKNESWVRNGLDYLHGSDDPCPFCQQALPHDFTSELEKLFDTAYEDQRTQLTTLRDHYKSSIAALVSQIDGTPYKDEYVLSDLALQNAWKDLRLILEHNATELDRKVGSPGDPVTLTDSSLAFSAWTARAGVVAAKIVEYNSRITNRDQGFIESLEGSHKSDGNSNKSNRIVVIDDPVSSLSHNHVYDIASLITINVIERKTFPHVIVLTHSLFFYHELFKAVREKDWKNYQCFRVTKKDFSEISEMRPDEIKNDYQSFWLVLKEGTASHKYSVAIPIAMRYILEHYFSFIGYRDKLRDALLALGDDDKPFHAFYRYINRQSHSDDINISDLPEIDPSIYVEKFRQVFDKTGYLRHFNHMMGIEETEKATEVA